MILGWNNKDAFKQHAAEMKLFRQSHKSQIATDPNLLENLLLLLKVVQPNELSLTGSLIHHQREYRIVPYWTVKLPNGVQN